MSTAPLPLPNDLAQEPPSAEAKATVGPGLRLQIASTLIGGTLLTCSLIAQVLWDNPFYPALPAALAVVLLGGPLLLAATRELARGEAGMHALVALAVVAAAATGNY